jgi:hypothetical protein
MYTAGSATFIVRDNKKLAERQLHIKNAKNYRGITVTPTLSKIIEKMAKSY